MLVGGQASSRSIVIAEKLGRRHWKIRESFSRFFGAQRWTTVSEDNHDASQTSSTSRIMKLFIISMVNGEVKSDRGPPANTLRG
jgi:hypothetical protein